MENYRHIRYFVNYLACLVDNLFGSDFSKIGYYNCKSLLDVGTVITINLNKNISNFTFILITFSDSGYNDIFHSYTIPVLLFKNYNLSFRFTIEPYMDLICSNPAYNDFINFKYKSEQEITFEVSKEETLSLCKKFLATIDPTLSWLTIFCNMLKKTLCFKNFVLL